jgi:hypothetical protein
MLPGSLETGELPDEFPFLWIFPDAMHSQWRKMRNKNFFTISDKKHSAICSDSAKTNDPITHQIS